MNLDWISFIAPIGIAIFIYLFSIKKINHLYISRATIATTLLNILEDYYKDFSVIKKVTMIGYKSKTFSDYPPLAILSERLLTSGVDVIHYYHSVNSNQDKYKTYSDKINSGDGFGNLLIKEVKPNEDTKEFLLKTKEQHFVIIELTNGKLDFWIEGFHKIGSQEAEKCEYIHHINKNNKRLKIAKDVISVFNQNSTTFFDNKPESKHIAA